MTTQLWYPYVPLFDGSAERVYAGQPTEQAEGESPPANASPWIPPCAGEGFLAYYLADCGAWQVRPDTRLQPLAEAQAVQIAVINQACQRVLAQITAPYPAGEVDTWGQQLGEAQAVTASTSVATPVLSAIAQASGRTVADLAASVLQKAAAYQAAAGAAIGHRQALCAQIQAATSVAAVLAIQW